MIVCNIMRMRILKFIYFFQGDRDKIASLIEEAFNNTSGHVSPASSFPGLPLPPDQLTLINTVPPIAAVTAAPTQVPMHSTS